MHSREFIQFAALLALGGTAACDERGNVTKDPETRALISEGVSAAKSIFHEAGREQDARTRRIAELDRKVADIQAHIRKGELDEAELLLVDVCWTDEWPSTHGARALAKTYDEKRAALQKQIDSRRSK